MSCGSLCGQTWRDGVVVCVEGQFLMLQVSRCHCWYIILWALIHQKCVGEASLSDLMMNLQSIKYW